MGGDFISSPPAQPSPSSLLSSPLPGTHLPEQRAPRGGGQYLHQRGGRPEAHLGHGLALAAPREAVEARAGAGEGAEGRGPRGDGSVGDAAAVRVLGHAERPAPGQRVDDLPGERSSQSVHPP